MLNKIWFGFQRNDYLFRRYSIYFLILALSGAFNLVVADASVIKAFACSNIWIYLAGCFDGTPVAALAFKMNNPDDK